MIINYYMYELLINYPRVMAAKEVKALLKSARTALDNQKYEEAVKQCEVSYIHYI